MIIAWIYNIIFGGIAIFGIAFLFLSTFADNNPRVVIDQTTWFKLSMICALLACCGIFANMLLYFFVSPHFDSEKSSKTTAQKYILDQIHKKIFYFADLKFLMDFAILLVTFTYFFLVLSLGFSKLNQRYVGHVFGFTIIFIRTFTMMNLSKGSSKIFPFIVNLSKDLFLQYGTTIIFVLSLYFLLVSLSGAFFYTIENPKQPDVFTDAFAASYFSVISFATIGFHFIFQNSIFQIHSYFSVFF